MGRIIVIEIFINYFILMPLNIISVAIDLKPERYFTAFCLTIIAVNVIFWAVLIIYKIFFKNEEKIEGVQTGVGNNFTAEIVPDENEINTAMGKTDEKEQPAEEEQQTEKEQPAEQVQQAESKEKEQQTESEQQENSEAADINENTQKNSENEANSAGTENEISQNIADNLESIDTNANLSGTSAAETVNEN